MFLGTSKIKITPQNPLRLCGYATRTSTFDGIKEDIYIRIQVHQHNDNIVIFVYGDLLWWGSDFVKDIKKEIAYQFDICPEAVFFMASHNHSGPPTSKEFTPTLETYDEAYVRYLKEKVIEGIFEGINDLEEVSGKVYRGNSNLNVYRRLLKNGKIIMAPNYEVKIDKTLTMVALYRKDGSLKGLMIHYPCHPNISNENNIQPDYPGVTLRMLDEKFSNSMSIFFQGCTADIRPNVVLGNKFISLKYEQVLEFAQSFYEDCCLTLQNDGVPLRFNLQTTKKEVFLYQENIKPLDDIKKMLESEEMVEREWAEKVLEKNNRHYEILEINKIDYGDRIIFLTYNGEMSMDYSDYGKELDKNSISIAYTNGMIGYISTKEQILEGGYEPEGSALYFALAGTYKAEIEGIIHQNIKDLVGGV